jgi:hypothetical protein
MTEYDLLEKKFDAGMTNDEKRKLWEYLKQDREFHAGVMSRKDIIKGGLIYEESKVSIGKIDKLMLKMKQSKQEKQ